MEALRNMVFPTIVTREVLDVRSEAILQEAFAYSRSTVNAHMQGEISALTHRLLAFEEALVARVDALEQENRQLREQLMELKDRLSGHS